MFAYTPHVYLCNGERSGFSSQWALVREESYPEAVTAVFVDAVAGDGDRPWHNCTFRSQGALLLDMLPQAKYTRYMANSMFDDYWWSRPFFGSDFSDIPTETQLLVLEKENGRFCVIVPVVNEEYRCVLRGKEGCIVAELSSYCETLHTCKGLALLYAEGENPTELISLCVKRALKLLNHGVRHISERRYPEVLEYLGWCSWDSMQIRVNEEGLLEKCEEFRSKNIPVRWAMLDDMWAEVHEFYGRSYASTFEMIKLMHRSALHHFEADPIRFPNGLASCIEKIKAYGISVGMWLPTTGYWRGIAPEGEAFRLLKDYLIQAEDGCYVPDWRQANAYMYYKTIHDFFRKCGADFVKIDKQSMARIHYRNLAPIGQCARQHHAGMEASVGEHFDGCMINCMGMGSESMWNRSVSAVARCSGDFQPENAAWFTRHILQCAYNSLLQGQLYWCDWDMWWTDDSQGPKNSLMRAISGGPVYVSDQIGRSRREILDPLALSDGRILRCDRPAVPTADCITRDPTCGHALKIQNMAGEHGVMAVLNVSEDASPVSAHIHPRQIDGFSAEEFVVYDHFTQKLVPLQADGSFDVTLGSPEEYKLYIFAPIKNGFAAIGRTDKFISPKSIRYIHGEDIVLWEDGPYAYVQNNQLLFSMGV